MIMHKEKIQLEMHSKIENIVMITAKHLKINPISA